MSRKYATSLFIFRRDLRIYDNTGLHAALNQSSSVIPCFIITPDQIGSQNSYRSMHAIQFMLQSLDELNDALTKHGSRLHLFYGKPQHVIAQLLTTHPISAVFVNKDYTPYSQQRDEKIKDACTQTGTDFVSFGDILLHPPGEVLNGQGRPYEIFTPFFKKSALLEVQKPLETPDSFFNSKKLPSELDRSALEKILPNLHGYSISVHGGRKSALTILANSVSFKEYAHTHNIPAFDTTLLSAHNKFGTVSIREVYHSLADALTKHHPLIRQLYWRDFFYQIAWFHPRVFGHAFHEKFDRLAWSDNKAHFARWCEGNYRLSDGRRWHAPIESDRIYAQSRASGRWVILGQRSSH